ncbi:MAG: hypothetical protein ACTTJS_01785 [Wolinella sp.]
MLETYLLSFARAYRKCPFGEAISVFKVGDKIFALLWLDVLAYREIYTCIQPLPIT